MTLTFLSKSYTYVWEKCKYFISYSVNKELKQNNLVRRCIDN